MLTPTALLALVLAPRAFGTEVSVPKGAGEAPLPSLSGPLVPGISQAPQTAPGELLPAAGVPVAAQAAPAAAPSAPARAAADSRRAFLGGALGRLGKAVQSITAANAPLVESAARKDTPPAALSGQSGRVFENRRTFLGTVLAAAAAVCVSGCPGPTPDYNPPPDGGGDTGGDSALNTVIPNSALVAQYLTNEVDPLWAYPAHVGYNTWDGEYHVGIPWNNDFLVDQVRYTSSVGSYQQAVDALGALPVDEAVGSRIVYAGGGYYALIKDTLPTPGPAYWTSRWLTVDHLYGPDEVQDQLNNFLTGAEAFNAKVAGAENGAVKLTYPVVPLDEDSAFWWELRTFDSFIEAMIFAQSELSDYGNRGMKIYFSPVDVAYHVLYPVDTRP